VRRFRAINKSGSHGANVFSPELICGVLKQASVRPSPRIVNSGRSGTPKGGNYSVASPADKASALIEHRGLNIAAKCSPEFPDVSRDHAGSGHLQAIDESLRTTYAIKSFAAKVSTITHA